MNQKLHPVDRLGAIRAQISDLRQQEKDAELEVRQIILRDKIGEPVLDGELFRARLVPQVRETLIAEKVRELLHPNQLRVCTRVTEVQSLKVTARSTEKAVA